MQDPVPMSQKSLVQALWSSQCFFSITHRLCTRSQCSRTVHGFSSLQSLSEKQQSSIGSFWHWLFSVSHQSLVQRFKSSHSECSWQHSPNGRRSWMHSPVAASQRSTVHGSASRQSHGVCVHCGLLAWNLSVGGSQWSSVQGLPSSHGARSSATHWPARQKFCGAHRSSGWSHSIGVWSHTASPVNSATRHVSTVQAFSSAQSSGTTTQPRSGSHDATWHASGASQTTGSWQQVPEATSQLSTVHLSRSSQSFWRLQQSGFGVKTHRLVL